MFRPLRELFHRPAIRMGRVDNSAIQTTRLRNAQFVSFMSESHSLQPFSADRYDARLRRRKRFKAMAALSVAAGVAWVVIESAQALSMF